MSTKDLFELASLDALGLLDESERAMFERAFSAAAPHVQAQVRRQQLHFTRIDDLLPDVAPPPGLKARVMAAVRGAIAAVAIDGQPIARISGGSIARMMNFAPLWRAACIGFATASLVLGWFLMGFANEQRRIDRIVSNDHVQAALVNQLGIDGVELLAKPNTRRVAFAPLGNNLDATGYATLHIDHEQGFSVLACVGLPHGSGSYLLVSEGDGPVAEVTRHRFEANGNEVQAVQMRISDFGDLSRLAIKYEFDGSVVFESTGEVGGDRSGT